MHSGQVLYAVGDIHGCLDLLVPLLDVIAADAARHGDSRPRVVFLGDYVDRGPDSKGVLDLLSSGRIDERFAAVYLLGNHDAALLNILRGAAPSADWTENEGGWKTMASYGDFRARRQDLSVKRFRAAVPETHRRFLGGLQVCWRVEGLFFSHAGVAPALGLDDQPFNAMVYGDPRMLWHDTPEAAAEMRSRMGARVVHGHWSSRQVVLARHRIGVDTGAGYATGRLSAVAIKPAPAEAGGENVRVLSC